MSKTARLLVLVSMLLLAGCGAQPAVEMPKHVPPPPLSGPEKMAGESADPPRLD